MLRRGEPIYENVQRDIENISAIDERVINFLNVVKQAPQDVQTATDKFIASIDKLKKTYISNIINNKKAERRHEDADRYLTACQKEFNFFQFQDDYLNQVSPDLRRVAVEKLEKAKLDRSMSCVQLQLASRELALSKERLCRMSKRAEHLFLTKLRNHPDKAWTQIYKNDAQRPRSELKRVCTIPSVLPKPAYNFRRTDSRDGCSTLNVQNTRSSSAEPIRTENSLRRSEKYFVQVPSRDNDAYSSDEEFPPPPPPIAVDGLRAHEQIVVVDVIDGKNKRHSDRSAVDEGIGDIDWRPLAPSECGSDVTETLESELIEDLDRITQFIDEIARLPTDCRYDFENHLLNSNKDDNIRETTTKLDSGDVFDDSTDFPEIPLEALTGLSDEKSELEVLPGDVSENPASTSSEYEYTKLLADEIPFDTEVDVRRSIILTDSDTPEVDSTDGGQIRNESNVALDLTESSITLEHESVSSYDTNLNSIQVERQSSETSIAEGRGCNDDNRNASDASNTLSRTNSELTVLDGDIISDMTVDGSTLTDSSHSLELAKSQDEVRRSSKQRTDRKAHVYEDTTFLPAYKKTNEKKKSKLKFLTKVFRGPWEGWEEDYYY